MISFSEKITKVFIVFYCFLFISCAQNPNLVSSSYLTIFSLVSDSFFKKEDIISPDTIESIPFASSLISFKEHGSKSLIILESKQNDTYRWVSSDRKIFLINNGRVTGTVGLVNDLYEINRPSIKFEEILKKGSIRNYVAYYSFKKPSLNNLRVEISVKVIGKQRTSIHQGYKDLILVEERLVSKKINWKKTNRYWVDPENFFVWKSEQSISPKLPMLFIEVTKKPAE